jgi:hypothetical protein
MAHKAAKRIGRCLGHPKTTGVQGQTALVDRVGMAFPVGKPLRDLFDLIGIAMDDGLEGFVAHRDASPNLYVRPPNPLSSLLGSVLGAFIGAPWSVESAWADGEGDYGPIKGHAEGSFDRIGTCRQVKVAYFGDERDVAGMRARLCDHYLEIWGRPTHAKPTETKWSTHADDGNASCTVEAGLGYDGPVLNITFEIEPFW